MARKYLRVEILVLKTHFLGDSTKEINKCHLAMYDVKNLANTWI